jgi:deoxyribose-phosphate aldolase
LSTPLPESTAAVQLKYEDLASLVEYTLVAPQLSEEDASRGFHAAKNYGVATVVIRPSDIDLIARLVGPSSPRLSAIAGTPHGYSTTAAKLYEARDLLRRGVHQLDTVMNTGKLISRQFQYLETELQQMADSCHQSGAILAVNLESEFLNEELKILACRIARRAGADYIGTNAIADVAFLRTHSRERLKIKSCGPIPDLATALAFRDAGCSRIQMTDPASVLEAWKAQVAANQPGASPAPAT